MTLLDPPARKPRRPRKPHATTVAGETRPPELTDGHPPQFRLTVDQYHRMIKGGILEEGMPVELLDGQLEWKDRSATGGDPMTVGTEHTWVVQTLQGLAPKLQRLGCLVRVQQPITLPPHHEPEPDVAIVRGTPEDYRGRHPGAADILCVIEVADSSLARDRTKKLRVYANGGVPLYLIFNLPDRVVERYAGPLVGKGRYAESATLGLKDKVTFPTVGGKGLSVAVKGLLP